jgi:hypothetical protein
MSWFNELKENNPACLMKNRIPSVDVISRVGWACKTGPDRKHFLILATLSTSINRNHVSYISDMLKIKQRHLIQL